MSEKRIHKGPITVPYVCVLGWQPHVGLGGWKSKGETALGAAQSQDFSVEESEVTADFRSSGTKLQSTEEKNQE
jgi:hypothetical protein